MYEAQTLQRGFAGSRRHAKADLIILDLSGLPDGDGIRFYSRPASVERRNTGDCPFRAAKKAIRLPRLTPELMIT